MYKLIACSSHYLLAAVCTWLEVCCFLTLQSVILCYIDRTVGICLFSRVAISIIFERCHVTHSICLCFNSSAGIICCESAVALICWIVRSIFSCFSAELIVLGQSDSGITACSEVLYLCNVVEFIVFVFLYCVGIFWNINTCFFLWYLKLRVIFVLNWIYNSISVLDDFFDRKSLCIFGRSICVLCNIPFRVCYCAD